MSLAKGLDCTVPDTILFKGGIFAHTLKSLGSDQKCGTETPGGYEAASKHWLCINIMLIKLNKGYCQAKLNGSHTPVQFGLNVWVIFKQFGFTGITVNDIFLYSKA